MFSENGNAKFPRVGAITGWREAVRGGAGPGWGWGRVGRLIERVRAVLDDFGVYCSSFKLI